jgi:hypothetical protein
LYWNHKRTEEREQRASAAEEAQLKTAIAQMISRWNAIPDWADAFRGRLRSEVYSAELQRAVLGPRPILLYAELNDVKRADTGFEAEMSTVVTQWPLHVHYHLFCDEALAQRLIGYPQGAFRLFAVVAQIERIERIEKRTQPEREQVNGGKYSFEEWDFLAEGRAEDVIFVGVRGLGFARMNSATPEAVR